MRSNQLGRQQGIGGARGIGEGGVQDAAFADLLSGPAMDVAALGLNQNVVLRSQVVGIVSARLNLERDSTQRVIESMAP